MKKYAVFLLIMLLVISPVIADHEEDEGSEDEQFGDLGENMGTIAIAFLAMGAIYVGFRRLYNWSRSWSEDKDQYKQYLVDIYRKSRKPLLIFHNITMILAVVAGAIHGLVYLGGEGEAVITGSILWIIMLLLSIFGAIIYYRMRPIWDNRQLKGFVRFIHRQWILSVVMVIFLGIHLSTT